MELACPEEAGGLPEPRTAEQMALRFACPGDDGGASEPRACKRTELGCPDGKDGSPELARDGILGVPCPAEGGGVPGCPDEGGKRPGGSTGDEELKPQTT